MTAPFGNFRYSSGSDLGEFAKLAGNFAQGSRDEADRRRKEALEAAVQALKEREANRADSELKLNTDKFGYEQGKDTKIFDAGQAEHTYQHGHDVTTDTETHRHNVATEQADLQRARSMGQSPGKLGWRLVQVDGEWTWVPPPTGLGAGSGGPQAQTVTGPDGKPAHGSQGIPNAGEQQMNMLVTSIEPSLGRIEAAYAPGGKGLHAPSVVAQGLADAAKQGGFIGGAANTALSGQGMMGKLANALGGANPDYQNILTDLTKVYRAYVYVTTGKQLNESEAADNIQQYVPRAGEPDELVHKKVQDIQNMAQAVRLASKRAREFVERQNAGGASGGAPAAAATSAQTDWDNLAAKYGAEETTKRIGPRP